MSIRKIFSSLFRLSDASTYVGHPGDIFFDPDDPVLKISDGATPGGSVLAGGSFSAPTFAVSYADQGNTANDSTGTIGSSGIGAFAGGAADVIYTVTTSDAVSATGVVVNYSLNNNNSGIATAAGLAATGANGVRFLTGNDQEDFIALVYATTVNGTFYSAPVAGTSRLLCLAEGTLITMADRSFKKIEDVTYADTLLVWDFDNRRFASSKPLWIKQPKRAPEYNSIIFSDGTELRTVGQHRIFNKEAGSFTYPLTDHTPIGTTSFTDRGKEVQVIGKQVVQESVKYYNVITDYHINLFANGILTSCSFNNMYPIRDMKFEKSPVKVFHPRGLFHNDALYDGLRVAEQPMSNSEIKQYISRLLKS